MDSTTLPPGSKAAGIVGSIAVLFVFGFVLAPDSSRSEMHADKAITNKIRRFLAAVDLSYRGPSMVRGNTKFDEYIDEILDFHGYKSRVVCAAYGGVDHPNKRGCCPESCGRKYCGTDTCHLGEGGAPACCEANMPRVWCGPHQMAPCMINVTHLERHFRNKHCLAHQGIDSLDGSACCPPTCGEYCGADFCGDFNPAGLDNMEKTECCSNMYSLPCGPGVNAPCFLFRATSPAPPASTFNTGTTSMTRAESYSSSYSGYDKYVGHSIPAEHVMKMWPMVSFRNGSQRYFAMSCDKPDGLPKWCNFHASSGDMQCYFDDSAYDTMPREKKRFAVICHPLLDNVYHRVVLEYFVPFSNPFTNLHYNLPEIFQGQHRLWPGFDCSWSSFDCAPTHCTISGKAGHQDLPKGIHLHRTGLLEGDFGLFKQAGQDTYTISCSNDYTIASFDFSVPGQMEEPTAAQMTGMLPASTVTAKPVVKIVYVTMPPPPSTTTAMTTTTATSTQVPLVVKYKQGEHFVSGEPFVLTPTVSAEVGRYTIEPELPAGMTLDEHTGVVQGTIQKPTKSMRTYTISVRTSDQRHTAIQIKLPDPEATPFPWWIIVGAILLLLFCFFLLCCCRKKKYGERKIGYVALTGDAEPQPVSNPPVAPSKPKKKQRAGFPITFDTGSGEQIVWAYAKPLGLKYKRELPITISDAKEGHGKDIGVKIGWIMKTVNYRDITGCKTFDEAIQIMHEEVGKLPGGVPLTWIVAENQEKTVWITKQRLGVTYHTELPVTVKEVNDGEHGDELGIRPGWVLRACNHRDVSKLHSFTEVNKVLHEEIGPAACV